MGAVCPAHVGRVLFRSNVIRSEVFAAKRNFLANGLVICRILVEEPDKTHVAPIGRKKSGVTQVETTIDDAQQHTFTVVGLREG